MWGAGGGVCGEGMDEVAAAQPEAQGPEVTTLLAGEHAEVRAAFAGLAAMRDPYRRRAEMEQLLEQLARHESAEEAAVYPVLALLPEGQALRSQALSQERQAKRLAARALRLSLVRPRSRRLKRLVDELAAAVEEHAAFEEASIFPLLRRSEGGEKLRMMGAWVQQAETLGPTRPHPHVPEGLPALVVMGPPMAVLDRVRDRLRRRLERRSRISPG